MDARLLLVAIATETDIVLVRKRSHRLAQLIGFERQDQNRITTAVSEIARNALEYAGGGQVEFRIEGSAGGQHFVIVVRDKGPGIADLDAVLSGRRKSPTGLGLGLLGARRLMEGFDLRTGSQGGTDVRLSKPLPRGAAPVGKETLRRIAAALETDGPADAMEEIRRQNQQILLQMEELRSRQEDLERLNQELQDTNRGVVALYAELDERADHLRRADELKSKFLSHMSHEFRTPLNSILALSRLLLSYSDGPLNGEQERQVQFIRKAAEDLTVLVNDLLDLAKVEAGKTVVSPSEFTAESLFGALRGMLRPLLVGDAVALSFDETADVPTLETDEAKVSQILRNFISNAIKFTERGEVRVWATADAASDTVSFHVRDTGVGIAADDIELIFQEFSQVDNKLQGRVKGTGLGLPLARKLAELLGGHIAVASTPGEGSTFSVTLPRSYAKAAGEVADPVEWQATPGSIPVLLVEDDPADAFVVERCLAETPYQVLHVPDLRAADVALRQMRPAVVLLDVLLATDESWRLMLRLRQDGANEQVPLVVISSSDEERKALHLGADAYLHKPLDRHRLLHVLDRMTGRQTLTGVLLVDDEEVTRYLVRQLLPRGEFSLYTAANGRDGLQHLNQLRPDIILLDINMPGMDGYEFLERLRGMPAVAGIPVVVITSALLTPAERLRLRSASAILSKSDLSTTVLIETIQDVLHPAETADTA